MSGVGTTHHVKIGDQYCILRPFSYSKKAAPLFGARVTTGDPDYNNLSIWQHWAQSCWVGGIDADQWVDDAMYDEAVGVDTTVHERISLSRDLIRPTGGALNAGSLDEPRRFLIYRNSNSAANTAYLYCLTMPRTAANSYLWKYTPGTNTWSLEKTWTSKRAKSFAIFGTRLVVGFDTGTLEHCTDPSGSWTSVALPAGVTGEASGMAVYNQKLYVAYNNQVWRRSEDFTTDGNTVFYVAQSADQIVDFCYHLGYLYMLSTNARLFRTDGSNTFDIWGWDGNTKGVSMQSYDGRLFLATYEYTDALDLGYGVLYQFSGSAVTQLKRFGAEGKATTIGRMAVYDRKLWYGASGLWGMNKNSAGTDLGGFGVAAYDAVEDGHSIFATNTDTTTYADASGVGRDWHVDDVIFMAGYMHIAVRNHGVFRTPITYRDYLRARAAYNTTTTAATGSANSGFLTSSDYDAGTIGIKKLWRSITVHCDLTSTDVNVGVDYSTDGGSTWTTAGTISKTLTGTVARTSGQTSLTGTGTAFLTQLRPGDQIVVGADTRTVSMITSNTALTVTSAWGATGSGATLTAAGTRFARVIPLQNVRSNRFKYRLRLNTSDGTESPVVWGVVVAYLPLPEPNWMWTFVVVNSLKQELLDGTVETVDTAAREAYFAKLFRNQEMFTFIDLEGVTWTTGGPGVLMYDYYVQPAVTGDPSTEHALEGDLVVTLLETVESY